MFILPAEADEAVVGAAVDRIAKIVQPRGGAIGEVDRWGRRRLAYPIDKKSEGYYVVIRFTSEPGDQPELERTLKLADEIVRHKINLMPNQKQFVKAASPASS
jgi:small subunit ribosomal protein S6